MSTAGNAGCTLITRSFARQLGLVDMHGNPTQAYSRTIRVQGVVAGAFEVIKTLNITYEIKGEQCIVVLMRILFCAYLLCCSIANLDISLRRDCT